MMNIDLRYVPFSRFGSYLAISRLEGERHEKSDLPAGLWLRNMHGDGVREVFLLEPLQDGKPLPFTLEPDIGELRLRTDGGVARLCIAEPEALRIRVEGVGLRMTMRPGHFNCAVALDRGRWLLNAASAFRDYTAVPLSGELRVDAPWEVAKCTHVVAEVLPGNDGVGECALHQTRGREPLPETYPDYEHARASVAADFDRFAEACPPAAEGFAEAARLAAYVGWASTVGPCGNLRRHAMLMSKNWMSNVWSWDHCFNAMAMAGGWPDFAWDQFMVMFDHQTEAGQLPDMINDTIMLYNFVKPPVHGWAYRAMLDANDWFAAPPRLAEVYGKLSAWTRWWLNCRDPNKESLPRYHHGNDSGWDNGTVFDVGLPVQGPDAAALLAVQTEVLADLARRLGRAADEEAWRASSETILRALLDRLYIGDRFVTRHAITGAVNEQAQSIIPCTPIVLGARLPETVRANLVQRITENLTEWGPATESPNSPLYEPDGYWRGPIWAPPAMLLVDGLRRAGENALAGTIAQRFCRLCAKSGFAENFDAVTGTPLRDRAYTWTSSVFQLLARPS